MILEDWVAFPVGNKYGLFTAGFIEGNMGNVNSKKGNISGIDNILVVFDAGENRTPGVYENPEKTKSFPMFVNWIDGKLTNSLKTTSLLLLFISHFHADHVNLIPAVIKEWVQRVNVKNSRMLIVFPSGNFMEGSLWVAKEHVARANYARVLIDAIASMGGDEDNSFDGESASNLLEIVRFIYGDNSVLIRWLENLDIDIDESDVDSMLNNIYRIIVPSIPEEGFDYESFYDLIIPKIPDYVFPHNKWFRWNNLEEGRDKNYRPYGKSEISEEFGGFSISCDYCISLKERNLSNWFMNWNIGVSNIGVSKAAVENTYVLLHKYEALPNKYKWNSPIPGIGVYADYSGKTELIHVFMPYFADRMKMVSKNAILQLERQYLGFLNNGASVNSIWCLQKMIQTQYKCMLGVDLNESSMVLFHAPRLSKMGSSLKSSSPNYQQCCSFISCRQVKGVEIYMDLGNDGRWYLMTGDQYMNKVVEIYTSRWRKEKIRKKILGIFE